ncbi:MAG: hypothetical protein GZ087_13900 [Flavobacterium sp.]|nr:hypothetical protein [Flavobacterium sp.]
MKKTITILSILILVTSCAVQVKNIELKRRIYDDVPLNISMKSEIGDKLITTGEEDYQDAIKIIDIQNFSISTVQFPYTSNDVLPYSGIHNDWDLYYDKSRVQTNYDHIGIAINKKNNQIKPFISSLAGFTTKDLKEKIKIEETEFSDTNCKSCFKREFIYNGKVGKNVKFIYREFINDMARPAFNQELQYDLDESKIIGFKGLRIEILSVTNTNIEYKILSSFTKK